MKTATLELPEDVLTEALCYSQGKTQQKVIVEALKEFSRKHKIEEALASLGRSETFLPF